MRPAKNPSLRTSKFAEYEGGHCYHFVFTPSCHRPSWHLEDVPDFVRICHPTRRNEAPSLQGERGWLKSSKPGVSPGSKRAPRVRVASPKISTATKQKVAAKKAVIEKAPKKMGRPRGRALKLFTGGVIIDVASTSTLRFEHKRQVANHSLVAYRRCGFHVFKDGAVVWLADIKTPEFVERAMGEGLLALAAKRRDGLAPCQLAENRELKAIGQRSEA